jgi:hypothetical protein
VRQISVHGDKCLLRNLHRQVMVEKELIAEIVNALVPQLHQFALGMAVASAGLQDQRIGLHHG